METVSAPVTFYHKLNRGPYRELYETRPYLEAYAAHTNQRVLEDPHAAVGGIWEALGRLQFNYLIAKGLKSDSRLLDLGCGTLRGGRHFIRYLNPGNYTGTDISLEAIEYAHRLVMDENLAAREPRLFYRRPGEAFFADLGDAHFDYILAQSVFTHLPTDVVEECFAGVGRVMRPNAVFFFTFWHEAEHRRKDLKDFAYPSRLFAYFAERHDLLFETRDDYNHPRGQTMASLRHQSLGLASVSCRASIKSALLAVTENQNDQIANRSLNEQDQADTTRIPLGDMSMSASGH